MIILLLKRRLLTAFNHFVSMKPWEFFVRFLFGLAAVAILLGLYFWFSRVLKYLDAISIIGPLLPWKLTSMAFLMTFSMVAISGLITAMTTLYYSFDLRFLFSSPISVRTLFADKAIEAALYSSWTLAAVLLPYIFALGRVKDASFLFYVYFLLMLIPFILLGAAFGIMLSMALMYFFPTSRTRDTVWVLSSLAFIFVYMMLRFAQPERLVRPDTLEVVAKYLQFLQAPTAPYLPSWWVSKGMLSFYYGQYPQFLGYAALLCCSVLVLYGILIYLSKWVYMKGFNGAQEGLRYGADKDVPPAFERILVHKKLVSPEEWTLFWKDRKLFMRDVRYWSQMALVLAIIAVYLFSIRQLPLEHRDLKSLVSFLNIAVAGFVVASLGLRFTFPAISLEGRSYWLLKSAPIPLKRIMAEKLLLLSVPSVVIGVTLVAWSNALLNADAFISLLSVGTIIMASLAFCFMGIGMGAMFPKFDLENIHQIESSAGGFIYMACCLGYLAATIALEAYPVKVHFYQKFANVSWDWRWLAVCAAAYAVLNIIVMVVPWKLGLKTLEKHEI